MGLAIAGLERVGAYYLLGWMKCPGDAMTLLGILFLLSFYFKENFYSLVTPSFRHPRTNFTLKADKKQGDNRVTKRHLTVTSQSISELTIASRTKTT